MRAQEIKATQRAYIRSVLDRKQWTATELARQAGLDPATLTRFLNSPKHKSNLTSTTLMKIEAVSEIKAPLPTTALPRTQNVSTLPVRGIAAAGLWKDVCLLDESSLGEIPVVPNARYAGRTQYALLVEGPSVNKRIADGSYAICVAWDEIGADLKDGQMVHVERTRGALQEATIKVVRIKRGKPELWPDSTDPRYQEPIDLSRPEADTEVRVRGLVIGTYQHLD